MSCLRRAFHILKKLTSNVEFYAILLIVTTPIYSVRQRDRETERVCVCLCVCEREKKLKRKLGVCFVCGQ